MTIPATIRAVRLNHAVLFVSDLDRALEHAAQVAAGAPVAQRLHKLSLANGGQRSPSEQGGTSRDTDTSLRAWSK